MSSDATVTRSRAQMKDPAASGWPRPKALFSADEDVHRAQLPVPWINAPKILDDRNWLLFRDDAVRAHTDRLCAVCGDPLGARILLGAFSGDSRSTSGPGCHPRCMWMTVNVCPHFVRHGAPDDDTVVAYLYEGPGVGYVNPYDDGDEAWQAEEWETEDMYAGSNPVDPSAVSVTFAELRALARRDPHGTVR
jgi:hypothetical protein